MSLVANDLNGLAEGWNGIDTVKDAIFFFMMESTL
jgi:hypothetical protein